MERQTTRAFWNVLVNTAVANLTTSFLWFALTFWAYIETESVLATGLIGGAYMLLLAFSSMMFGTIVDRFRKRRVMLVSAVVTAVSFVIAGVFYLSVPGADLIDLGQPWFWVFAVIILVGAVVEQLRSVALSTLVTMLVPDEGRAKANGVVGAVQGIAFVATSVFSGIALGLLGMGWTIAIAVVLVVVTFVHLVFVQIPGDERPADEDASGAFDIRGAVRAVRSVPGLFALIIFSTFNNLIGGVYMALMDPYGLELFSVEMWGVWFGVGATGFIAGGLLLSKTGLGKNPIRTLLLVVIAMGALGAVFTLREWAWLYVVGIWLYMAIIPIVEAAEQTAIQRVVPLARQGRVFGFAMMFEAAAAPVTAFVIAPIADAWIIPYSRSDQGRRELDWLLGQGEARGIALIFLIAGIVMVLAAIGASFTKSYRLLSKSYASAAPVEGEPGADGEPVTGVDVPPGRAPGI